MSADVSSSSKPNGVCINATSSLDGVLLSCSENVASLTELMATPFDTLVLTLQPTLVGENSPPPSLEQSIHFTLLSQEPSEDGLRLTYQRQPKN
jgi:hypothetical protein